MTGKRVKVVVVCVVIVVVFPAVSCRDREISEAIIYQETHKAFT